MSETLYTEIAAKRQELGFKPECEYCENTGYRKDYVGQKPCTKCFSVNSRNADLEQRVQALEAEMDRLRGDNR